MMIEELDSPGCTLEVRMMHFREAISAGSLRKFVMISITTTLPASDLQRFVFLTLSLLLKVHILLLKLH